MELDQGHLQRYACLKQAKDQLVTPEEKWVSEVKVSSSLPSVTGMLWQVETALSNQGSKVWKKSMVKEQEKKTERDTPDFCLTTDGKTSC